MTGIYDPKRTPAPLKLNRSKFRCHRCGGYHEKTYPIDDRVCKPCGISAVEYGARAMEIAVSRRDEVCLFCKRWLHRSQKVVRINANICEACLRKIGRWQRFGKFQR